MVFKEWDNHNFLICHSNKFCLSKKVKTKPRYRRSKQQKKRNKIVKMQEVKNHDECYVFVLKLKQSLIFVVETPPRKKHTSQQHTHIWNKNSWRHVYNQKCINRYWLHSTLTWNQECCWFYQMVKYEKIPTKVGKDY